MARKSSFSELKTGALASNPKVIWRKPFGGSTRRTLRFCCLMIHLIGRKSSKNIPRKSILPSLDIRMVCKWALKRPGSDGVPPSSDTPTGRVWQSRLEGTFTLIGVLDFTPLLEEWAFGLK